MDALDLTRRDGLPDALRVLAERFPRAGWEGHRNFSALTRFWLDRHGMFRRVQARLEAAAAAHAEGRSEGRAAAEAIGPLGGVLINELHTHHHIEDQHYFPILAARDARLTRAFELLDADHHVLDARLHALAGAATAVLRAPDDPDAAGRFHDAVLGFQPLLHRHLTDEEEIVVPVILAYGSDGLD